MWINGIEHQSTTQYIEYLINQGYNNEDIIDCLVTEWGTTHLNAISILDNYHKSN
jgi:hypothetical protein